MIGDLLGKVVGTARRVVTVATGIPTTTDFDKYIDHADFTQIFQEFSREKDSEEADR